MILKDFLKLIIDEEARIELEIDSKDAEDWAKNALDKGVADVL